MGMLIEGKKIFEDERVVTYSFDWSGAGRTGEVSIVKAEVRERLSTPDSGLDPAGVRILMKAYKESVATGIWPERVLYAA